MILTMILAVIVGLCVVEICREHLLPSIQEKVYLEIKKREEDKK